MKPWILLSLPLILLLGCTVAKDIDFIEPGTVCEIIPWQPRWSTRLSDEAALSFSNGTGIMLKSGTRIAVLREVPPRDTRFRNTKILQNAVHVLDGPFEGVEGVVMRPHLRVTSEPMRLDLVKPAPPPAQPATPAGEANKLASPALKGENATPKQGDQAEPATKPGTAAMSSSSGKAAAANP
jgi:hypothetical protein